MKNFIIAILLALVSLENQADTLFSQGFEIKPVVRQFPYVDGSYQLPNYPVSTQLQWFIQQLSESDTSLADINNHFDLSTMGLTAQQVKDFIQAVRNDYPDGIITDVIMVTPVRATVLIADPLNMTQFGFTNIKAEYSGLQRINSLGVSTFFGSVQYPADQTLTMNQALDKFQTLSSESSILVAEINSNGACQPLYERNSSQLRATASVFKIWVLAAAAEAFLLGDIDIFQNITLVASEMAPGGTINSEPLGTNFPLIEIATLMLGISDNTATDLLHETVGRDLINLVISSLNLSNPDALTPLLSINEQFHLFFSFPLATTLSYVNGTEAFQQQFLEDEIVPLGPVTTYPFNNDSIFVSGSWRASPMDICKTFSFLRDLPQGSDSLYMTDVALGSQVAQPDVRDHWDRVWYKGGSLTSGVNGLQVLTHAWMLENQGENPKVVITMSNDSSGGIDIYAVQSIAGRVLRLARDL